MNSWVVWGRMLVFQLDARAQRMPARLPDLGQRQQQCPFELLHWPRRCFGLSASGIREPHPRHEVVLSVRQRQTYQQRHVDGRQQSGETCAAMQRHAQGDRHTLPRDELCKHGRYPLCTAALACVLPLLPGAA